MKIYIPDLILNMVFITCPSIHLIKGPWIQRFLNKTKILQTSSGYLINNE